MTGMSEEAVRRARGRAGGHGRVLAAGSGAAAAAPAQAGFLRRFDREVDPDGVLPAEQRAALAKQALRRYMAQLALKRRRAAPSAPDRGEPAGTVGAVPAAGSSPGVPAESAWEAFLEFMDTRRR